MKLIIEDDEGQKRVVPVVSDEVTIGRDDGNTVRLPERNVSRRHARLRRDNGYFVIEDLGSSNGVRINGDRIAAPRRIQEGDLIQIGDYDLGIEGKIEAVSVPPQMQEAKPPPPVRPAAATTPPAATGASGSTAIIRMSDLARAPRRFPRREIPKAEQPRLVGISQSVRGQEFALERTEVRLGRSRENDIIIEHPSLSRQHARLVLEDDDWKIVDNSSANGVRVNGETYAMSAVRPGDVIELGHVKLRFCAPGERFIAARDAATSEDSARGRFPAVAVALGAVVVAAALTALVFFKGSKPAATDESEIAAAAAVKAGDVLFREKEFIRALELYEQAAAKGANPANLARASDEARAQRTDRDLDRAITAGDFEKAKALLEKCGEDPAYYCAKAREKADLVQKGYAKVQLEKAQAAAKAAKPEAAAQAPAKDVKKRPVQSQAVRDEKARVLLNAGNSLIQSKQYPAAMAKYRAALELKPSGPVAGGAYRGLGTAAVYAGDAKAAVKWFKRYLPYVDDATTREQVQTLIRQYSGE